MMRKLHIHNYKNIHNDNNLELGALTCVVGKYNTYVLEALSVLGASLHSDIISFSDLINRGINANHLNYENQNNIIQLGVQSSNTQYIGSFQFNQPHGLSCLNKDWILNGQSNKHFLVENLSNYQIFAGNIHNMRKFDTNNTNTKFKMNGAVLAQTVKAFLEQNNENLVKDVIGLLPNVSMISFSEHQSQLYDEMIFHHNTMKKVLKQSVKSGQASDLNLYILLIAMLMLSESTPKLFAIDNAFALFQNKEIIGKLCQLIPKWLHYANKQTLIATNNKHFVNGLTQDFIKGGSKLLVSQLNDDGSVAIMNVLFDDEMLEKLKHQTLSQILSMA